MAGRRRALTLLELLLVIALLGFLAAFLWPVFGRTSQAGQLDESARRMGALLAMCRAQALNESRVYRISFQADGGIRLQRQLDAILAPQIFVKLEQDWAATPFVLEEVWVESVLPLPEGPPPLIVEDDYIEFYDEDELGLEPIPVSELEQPFNLDFRPDGSSASARWVLRDRRGRGLRLTLDGRLGRIAIEPAARVAEQDLERPPPLAEPEPELRAQDFELERLR